MFIMFHYCFDLFTVFYAIIELQDSNCCKGPTVARIALVSHWLHAEIFAPVNLSYIQLEHNSDKIDLIFLNVFKIE